MKVTSNPRLARTSTITKPLRMAWVEGERPLIHPAGPDCGFMIQAVMIVAATPPMMMARICWSLKRFFIGVAPRLAGVLGAPNHRNALGVRQVEEHLCWGQAEDRTGGIAFDDVGAGAGAVRCGVGHGDALHAFAHCEIRRDVTAGADPECAADLRGPLGDRHGGQGNLAVLGVVNQPARDRLGQGGGSVVNVALIDERQVSVKAPDFIATSPAAASTISTPTAPTTAGLLLAVLPAPDVLIAGGAADGVCAESNMPLSLSIGPFASHAAGRKFILRKMPQSPPPQCDAEHSMAQGQGCANHQQCPAFPTKPPEPMGASRAAGFAGGASWRRQTWRLSALALDVVDEGDGRIVLRVDSESCLKV